MKVAAALVLAAIAGVTLAALLAWPRTGDPAACKKAMSVQLKAAIEDPAAKAMGRPSECGGLDDETLQRLAGEVLAEQVGG